MEPDEVPNELVSDAYLDKMERVVLNADNADPPTLQNTPERRRVHDNFTLAAISEIRSLREWIESVELALAASQASERAAREALGHLLREWMAWQPGLTGVARTRAEAILSRPPGSDAALRAKMVLSWEAGYLRGCGGCNPTDGPPWDEGDCRNRDAAIARLLEPPAEARDGGAR